MFTYFVHVCGANTVFVVFRPTVTVEGLCFALCTLTGGYLLLPHHPEWW